jgi:DNA polymerase IV
MVDSEINWLFVDLNFHFASIEQELCPVLRGQPIAIVPIRIEAQTYRDRSTEQFLMSWAEHFL